MDAKSNSSSYKEKFSPEVYLQQYLGDSSGLPNYLQCELDVLNEIFSGGKKTYNLNGTVNLKYSDISPKELVLATCPWRTEGASTNVVVSLPMEVRPIADTEFRHAVKERNAELRKKVKSILSIDVQKRNPLSHNEMLAFDAIVSAFCLECVSGSRENYKIDKVKILFKTNGKCILLGALDLKTYKVGDVAFEMAAISEKDILEIYKELVFKVELFQVYNRGEKPDGCDEFAVVATKMIDLINLRPILYHKR